MKENESLSIWICFKLNRVMTKELLFPDLKSSYSYFVNHP